MLCPQVEEQVLSRGPHSSLFYLLFCRRLILAVMWAKVATEQVERVERGQVPLPALRGAVVMGLLLQSEDFLRVVPVPVVWCPMALLVGPDLGCKRQLKLRRLVVRCRCGHQVVSWHVGEWLVQQHFASRQGAS